MEQIKQILKNKKIYLRDFIAIIVIFFLSLFVEQVLLQWNSFKNEKYEQTFLIDVCIILKNVYPILKSVPLLIPPVLL